MISTLNAQHFLHLHLQKESGPNLTRQPRNNYSALVIFRLLLCLLSGATVPRILKTNLRRVLRRYMQLRFGSPVILRRPVVAGHRVPQLTRPLVYSLRCNVLSAYIPGSWLCELVIILPPQILGNNGRYFGPKRARAFTQREI
jgi:hypothetical protein